MPAYKFVEDIMKPWLAETSRGKSISTLQNETYCTKRLLEFFDGWYVSASKSRKMKIIDGVAVSQYREWRKLKVKPQTVQHELRFAVTACNYAIREKNYEMPNPFAGRTISTSDQKALKVRRQQISTKGKWTLAEEKRFMLAAEPFVADVVGFALQTGLRLNEILLLVYEDEWCHEDYERIVGRTITFAPQDQKSGFWGESYMNDEAFRILNRQKPLILKRRPDDPNERPKLYAFPFEGAVMTKRKFNDLFRKARDAAGLGKDLTMQKARKACGQRMLDAGADLEGVQAQLRHESLKTTESHYVTKSVVRAKRAVEKMNR